MLPFVIIFNLLLTSLNCYLLVQLLKFYGVLKDVTNGLVIIEQQFTEMFAIVPPMLLKGQKNTSQLREYYQKLLRQVTIIQTLVKTLKLFWKLRYRNKFRT